MLYKQKRVKLPAGMDVGSRVAIFGDGDAIQKVRCIIRAEDGGVTDIVLSDGSCEPLCQLSFVPKYRKWFSCIDDPKCQIEVAIGECDICGKPFPDSCQYHQPDDNPSGMICMDCHRKETTCKREPSYFIV